MLKNYILDANNQPIEEPDLIKWSRWFEEADRQLENTIIGNIRISTIFLGIDHNFSSEGPPVLWETMIFGGPNNGYQNRYSYIEDARAGHKLAVYIAKGEITPEALQEVEKALGNNIETVN